MLAAGLEEISVSSPTIIDALGLIPLKRPFVGQKNDFRI